MNRLTFESCSLVCIVLLVFCVIGTFFGVGNIALANAALENQSGAADGTGSAMNDASYRMLDWKDLVSPTWEPPIIMPAPDESGHVPIDPASLVGNLDNTAVKIPGYMMPVKFTGNQVTEFLLIPFLEHHVPLHMHHEPNQMVYVSLSDPLLVHNPYEPFWVEGVIKLESIETDEGDTGYHLIDAAASVYVY